jgi:hypothetical protein
VRVPAEPEAPDPYPWLAELEAQPVPAPEQLPGSHDLDFIRECVARNPGGYTDTFKYLLSLIPASQPPSGDARALFNEDEDAAMAHLNGFMVALRGWGLSANQDEMVAAIHVLQGFVVQHAVARQFSGLSDWFAAKEDSHE